MLVEKDIKKLFQQLLQDDTVHVEVDGSDITLRVYDHASKLFLSTPVFFGGNYIPKSVRQSLSHKLPFSLEDIKTYLTVDEKNYQIILNYLGSMDNLSNETFKGLVENFSTLASEWKLYLDDQGGKDLIHVRVS